MPTQVPSKPRFPRHPFGEYVVVTRDPWMTDSILGPMYGAKVVFVSHPDLKIHGPRDDETDVKPDAACSKGSTVTRIQPHPYTAEEHPAHAARAKWLKEYEERKLNEDKSADVACPAQPQKFIREVTRARFAGPSVGPCNTN